MCTRVHSLCALEWFGIANGDGPITSAHQVQHYPPPPPLSMQQDNFVLHLIETLMTADRLIPSLSETATIIFVS
jgi:hypothetical protein